MELESLRKKIDRIDEKIVSLLNERAELVEKVMQLKERPYHPHREQEVYKKVLRKKGAFPEHALIAVFREIMSASFVHHPPKVAFLGPEATFTHMAARQRFGECAKYLPLSSIEEVFTEVEKERAHYGVVPIENSIEGVVTSTLDMFVRTPLKICAEVLLQIRHNLLSEKSLEQIKRVYSHPHAFAQCREWLRRHLPKAECMEVQSTADAAKRAREEGASAIASKLAASLYKLPILIEGIEDHSHNYTRFLIIGKQNPPPTGEDKTSILFCLKDEVGALYAALEPFAKCRINLTKIESRPSRRQAWEYIFFVDMQGHVEEENVKDALSHLQSRVTFLKILGSYPMERMQ
jgi:chorismate mutase/prephenate dehydratase